MARHAVLIHVASVPDEGLGALAAAVGRAARAAGAGELDGHEVAVGGAVLFLYGPDAERLWASVEPILRSARLGVGSYAILRTGEPGADERRIPLA